MKVTYWYARCLGDADCYSIREATKHEAEEQRIARGADGFSQPVKVVVEYDSGLDLLKQCKGEGGLYQETQALLDCK